MLNREDISVIGPSAHGCSRLTRVAFVFLALMVPARPSMAQQAVICNVIGEAPGALEGPTVAYGINSAGHVVGEYRTSDIPEGPSVTHGFLLIDGLFTTIDYPGASSTSARGINDSGQIVGSASYGGGRSGFVLANGQFTPFAYPGTDVVTEGTGINGSGIVVGYYNGPPDYQQHGFILSQGTFTTIDAPGALHTGVWGINDGGTVVGYGTTPQWSNFGFTWTAGNTTVLDPFPGSYATEAMGINNAGDIVGNYATSVFPYYGGFKLKSGQYSTPNCPGITSPPILAINDAGQLLGGWFVSSPSPASARVRLNAFIRYEYLFDPAQTEYIFEGDNRTFCEVCGTERISQEVTVANPVMFEENTVDGPYNSAWITQKYDWMTSLDTNVEPWPITQEAREDWVEGWPMKVAWGVSNIDSNFCDVTRVGPEPTNTMQVHCSASASNPLQVFAPPNRHGVSDHVDL